ncbi:MAG TPA: metallophosphoesterase [Ignavibacteria bacterium]|nr:metallophosphoesterase [Ignavibacteria bacterium]
MKKLFLILILLNSISGIFPHNIFGQGKFLNFSDIHFDPFYDSTLVMELLYSDSDEWENIYSRSKINSVSNYGSDCNFILLKSALNEMTLRIPHPDFIIINGDFMSHNFNEDFSHFTGIENSDTLNLFIEKTIRFITSVIVKHYPGKQIFPVLGNDDAYCGNYMIEPDGGFVKMAAEVWEPMVNINGNNFSFRKDFSKGGYCTADLPGDGSVKMILMNTVFFSPKYRNLCGDTTANPGKDELIWLSEELEKCRQKNQKVYLSYHIPPGIDIFGTINGKGNCEEKIFSSWKKEYNDEFIKLVNEYSSVIIAQFGGHFHRDDFRIFFNESVPVSYLHITSSISPVYGNNPSFQVFSYNTANYNISDYETFYLNLSEVKDNTIWEGGYSFQNAFTQRSYDVNSLKNVYELIKSDAVVREIYIKYYTSDNVKVFNKDYKNWLYNYCGIGHLKKNEFANCLCSDSVKAK